MDAEQIKAKIIEHITKTFKDRVDTTNIPLDGGLIHFLGIDSLSSLELLVDMESLFDIEIRDDMVSFDLVDNINHMAESFSKLKTVTC